MNYEKNHFMFSQQILSCFLCSLFPLILIELDITFEKDGFELDQMSMRPGQVRHILPILFNYNTCNMVDSHSTVPSRDTSVIVSWEKVNKNISCGIVVKP